MIKLSEEIVKLIEFLGFKKEIRFDNTKGWSYLAKTGFTFKIVFNDTSTKLSIYSLGFNHVFPLKKGEEYKTLKWVVNEIEKNISPHDSTLKRNVILYKLLEN